VTGVDEYDRQVLESALNWWRDAGVDTTVEDAPRDWFAKPVALPTGPATPLEVNDVMPAEWDAFVAWRAGPSAPEAAWLGDGVLASGPLDAAVMVLADVPDREDCAAGALLTGEAGRLFDRMLAAIGLSRESVHLASVCSKRPTGGRVSRADQERLGEVARHHVGLVTPKRLLLMGDAASRAVLGTEVLRARGRSHAIDHRSGKSEAVATFHPRFLLENPARKREAWADLLLLMRSTGS
jgi:uracil-DNA glycosylase family 4